MPMTRRTESGARSVRAVICDLDGTLIDSERVFAEAARRLLAVRGKQLDPTFMASIQGTPGRDAMPRFLHQYELSESLEELKLEYKRHFYESLAGTKPPLLPGVVELLDRLDAHRVPRAIATSSRREYVDTVFAPYGLMERFDFVLTADDVSHGKPHPEIFEKAVAQFGLPKSDVIVIEDSVAGLRAAVAAGVRCIIVPHMHTPMDLVAEAHAICDCLDDPELWRILEVV
jgi:HAD superfamily hydrolase (TIGR01509 family)